LLKRANIERNRRIVMAVDMFIKIEGVKGESKDTKKPEWIDVLAWSWGASQSGSAHLGSGAGAGKVNVQDLSLTKYIDKASADLMLACCNGKHFPKAELVVRKAGEQPLEYLKVTMEDLIITSVQTGGSGGEDRLTENVSLNFAKVQVEYSEQQKDGSGKPVAKMGWDIAGNVKY
jgi:type VI secretion system secreted protein Hcp